MATMYVIADWDRVFECSRTRELKRPSWVPLPIKQGPSYCRLMRHQRGAEFYGAFMAIVQVAAGCDRRGRLARSDGTPYSIDDIADLTRMPFETVRDAMSCLITEIRWVLEHEVHGVDGAALPESRTTLPDSRTALPDGAGNRLLQDKTVQDKREVHTPEPQGECQPITVRPVSTEAMVAAGRFVQALRAEEVRRKLTPTRVSYLSNQRIATLVARTQDTDPANWEARAKNAVERRVRSGSDDSAACWTGTDFEAVALRMDQLLTSPGWSNGKGNGGDNLDDWDPTEGTG